MSRSSYAKLLGKNPVKKSTSVFFHEMCDKFYPEISSDFIEFFLNISNIEDSVPVALSAKFLNDAIEYTAEQIKQSLSESKIYSGQLFKLEDMFRLYCIYQESFYSSEEVVPEPGARSVEKGIAGELFVEQYIESKISINHEWHVTNISKDCSFNSDLELVYKKLHCVIEVKNIKTKIAESNLKKFREQYILSESKEYNSGIFISLESGFGPRSGVFDFSISEIQGRFVVYLAKVKESPEKIIFAMEVLNQLIDVNYDRDTKKLLDLLNKQLKNYTVLTSNANKMAAALKELKTNIAEFKNEIISAI